MELVEGAAGVGRGALPRGRRGAVVYRRQRRDGPRRRLAGLPADERWEVLLPLANAGGDAGRIAMSLLRETDAPAEVCPAPAPGGRRSEVTPEEAGGCTGWRGSRSASEGQGLAPMKQ